MFESQLKRSWLVLSAVYIGFFIGTLTPLKTYAQNLASAPMIFDVRRSLPLEPGEQVYKDFYINAGPEAGFKKGQYLTVVRLIPVHDPVQMKQQANLTVTVAKLQVIQTERNITVARLQSELTDEERPTLEFEAVMIGDRIDPAATTMDAPSKKRKTAQVEAPVPAPIAIVVAAVAPPVQQAIQQAIVAVPAEAKSASPASPPADMVRVPVPEASKQP